VVAGFVQEENMNIFMKLVLVAVLGMALPAWAGSGSKMLLVYEVIGQAPGYAANFNAYVAAPLFSAKPTLTNPLIGLSYSLSNNLVSNAGGIAQLPVVPDNPVPTQAALVQAGSQIAQQNYAAIAQAMTAYMAKTGLSSGIFNFQQQVMVQGNPNPMYLDWQMLVDANGRPRYGDMQLVPSVPITVYGLYTSQTVDAGLPASFAYPNAGTLQWEPIQMPNNNPLLVQTTTSFTVTPANLQTFNVGSTFDEPQSQNGVTVDPQWGLECLINHSAWTSANATAIDPVCPNVPVNGYTDFMTLLNAQGASGGYLDYVNSLTPVYNTVNVPQISVDVTSRTMTGGGQTCTFASSFCAGCVSNGKDSGVTQISCPNGAIPAGWLPVARCLDYAPVGKVCQIQGYGYTVQSSSFPPIAACPVRAYALGFNIPDCTIGTLLAPANGAVGGAGTGPTYTNSGTIGYEVQSVVDRYYVLPDGAYTLLNELTFPQQAPTQSYSYSVTLPGGATLAGYANMIIDPFGTDQVYDYTNDTVNGLPASAYTVAPIQ
jgi:hypothetical protein